MDTWQVYQSYLGIFAAFRHEVSLKNVFARFLFSSKAHNTVPTSYFLSWKRHPSILARKKFHDYHFSWASGPPSLLKFITLFFSPLGKDILLGRKKQGFPKDISPKKTRWCFPTHLKNMLVKLDHLFR